MVVKRTFFAIALILLGGCQTIRLDDGTEVQALVIPVPNSYTDTWEAVKLVANAAGYGLDKEIPHDEP